jgi:hypothetical protein
LADIVHRSIFRSKIDFLVASELNRDVNFYSNITETTSRDLHCYFIQVNTSEYGDSRVTHPKKSDLKDSLRIKGGLNTSLLVDELDIEKPELDFNIANGITYSLSFGDSKYSISLSANTMTENERNTKFENFLDSFYFIWKQFEE